MELTAMKLDAYLELVASNAPAPGGGSASALMGAQGIGLAAMAARLTLGRAKYADCIPVCETQIIRADEIREKLTAQIDTDTEAFSQISDAMKLPKVTDEEKAARNAAIAKATLFATQVPLETMRLGLDGLDCLSRLVGRSNSNCASDVGVGALGLVACVRGAWLNVLINIGGVAEKDKAENIRSEGLSIIERAEALSETVYREIKGSL